MKCKNRFPIKTKILFIFLRNLCKKGKETICELGLNLLFFHELVKINSREIFRFYRFLKTNSGEIQQFRE